MLHSLSLLCSQTGHRMAAILNLPQYSHIIVSVSKNLLAGVQDGRAGCDHHDGCPPALVRHCHPLWSQATTMSIFLAQSNILMSLFKVWLLYRMADLGMTIVTVVHQPRYGIFILFDEVLVLGKAGRTVYQGPSAAALPYFNSLGFQLPPNENPADFCLDVVSGSIPCQASPDFRPEVGFDVLAVREHDCKFLSWVVAIPTQTWTCK